MIELEFPAKDNTIIHIKVLGKEELSSFENQNVSPEEISHFYRKTIQKHTGITREKIFLLNQEHGDNYYSTRALKEEGIDRGDGMFSLNTGEALAIKTADCMPIFLFSPSTGLIAALHSGWRGTMAGISEKFLFGEFPDTFPPDLKMYIGPCIRKDSYEIKEDVARYFMGYLGKAMEEKRGSYYLGLDEVLKIRVRKVHAELEILDSEIDTMSNYEYYSHRRNEKGRNLNVIYREAP